MRNDQSILAFHIFLQQRLGIRMHAGELLGDRVLRSVLQALPSP
jgi:hypothetical protein